MIRALRRPTARYALPELIENSQSARNARIYCSRRKSISRERALGLTAFVITRASSGFLSISVSLRFSERERAAVRLAASCHRWRVVSVHCLSPLRARGLINVACTTSKWIIYGINNAARGCCCCCSWRAHVRSERALYEPSGKNEGCV